MSSFATFTPGAADLETRAALLAERLSDGLKPLAEVAYNYALELDSATATQSSATSTRTAGRSPASNPVQFLDDLWPRTQEASGAGSGAAGAGPGACRRASTADLARPDARLARHRRTSRLHLRRVRLPRRRCRSTRAVSAFSPATSSRRRATRRCAMVGVGLLYRRGYFRQRLDLAGRQHEYWLRSATRRACRWRA